MAGHTGHAIGRFRNAQPYHSKLKESPPPPWKKRQAPSFFTVKKLTYSQSPFSDILPPRIRIVEIFRKGPIRATQMSMSAKQAAVFISQLTHRASESETMKSGFKVMGKLSRIAPSVMAGALVGFLFVPALMDAMGRPHKKTEQVRKADVQNVSSVQEIVPVRDLKLPKPKKGVMESVFAAVKDMGVKPAFAGDNEVHPFS
ncbi:hypothetical protein KJ780_04065 [Candidatus Micrarchaeota archaeon]|nr:hypothetical protein [Candidatus Micrarchaeota archaeon]